MANIAIFRINYKSDFILTLNSDAGWMTPFCIKFWTGAPSQAYFVGYDGETYTHCAPVAGDPTKLAVQFDDHHLPIGDLKFQIGYHFTVADFPTTVEDEVINQASVIIEVDDAPAQVMLDLNGETAPEIEFSLPAYANEAQRIANEEQRIANETQRIANEETRIQHEEARIAAEQTRQQNEQQRINQEQARVNEFAVLKRESEQATTDANNAAENARQKAQLARDKATLAQAAAQLCNDKAALAQAAAQLANDKAQLAADKAALAQAASQLCDEKAALAQQKATYAQQQGDYSKAQGDYAKEQGDYSKEQGDYSKEQGDYSKEQGDYAKEKGDICAADHQTAVADHQTATADHQTAAADHQTATADHNQAGNDHTRAESDHTRAESDHAAVEPFVDSLGAFDISAYHATGGVLAKYADLTAALGTNGANIPDALRKGGMSIKFVLTSDNKYVQYRLTKDEWSNNVSDWRENFGSNFYFLEYWGSSSSAITALNDGVYFYNMYDDTIGRKTAPAGMNGFASYPIKKNDLCYYNGRLYTSIDGSTMTDISNIIQNSFIEQIKGSDISKIMSQKSVTEEFDCVESSIGLLVEKLSSGSISYIQPSSILDSKVLSVGSGLNAGKVHCGSVSNDSYKVNVYDVSEISSLIFVQGSANFNNAYYAFFTSSDFSFATNIGTYDVSGSDLSKETFCVTKPIGATYLLVAQKDLGCLVGLIDSIIGDISIINDIQDLQNDIQDLQNDIQDLQSQKNLRVDIIQELECNEKIKGVENLGIPIKKLSETITPSSTISNGYIPPAGNLSTSANFSLLVYDIEGLESIDVVHGCTRWGNPFYAFYSDDELSSSTLIELSLPETKEIEEKTFNFVTVPAGAKYLAINQYKNTLAYAQSIIGFNIIPVNTLYGKKWACVGDSLTEVNTKTTKHYFDYIAEDTGVIPLNYGVSGTGYARHREDNIAFYQRVSSIDLSADFITIFGSFNDLGALSADFPLGDITDTGTTTMAGCINTTIDNIQTRFPLVKLGIVSPTPWNNTHPGVASNSNDYVNLIKNICEYRSIPYLDLWKCSNLHPWDSSFRTLAYSKDDGSGVHPDENGHALIAPMFREFIKKLI